MGCVSNRIFNNELKSFIESTIIPFLRESVLLFLNIADQVAFLHQQLSKSLQKEIMPSPIPTTP
jgi:hypothetical protein